MDLLITFSGINITSMSGLHAAQLSVVHPGLLKVLDSIRTKTSPVACSTPHPRPLHPPRLAP